MYINNADLNILQKVTFQMFKEEGEIFNILSKLDGHIILRSNAEY